MKDKRDFMKYWHVVRYFIRKKYNISQADLDMLFFLKSERYFTRSQFLEYDNILVWQSGRFDRLRKEGYIMVWRKRNKRMHTVYTLSNKGLTLLREVYDMLQGEKMPATYRTNPTFRSNKNLTTRERLHRNWMMKIRQNMDDRKPPAYLPPEDEED